MAAVAEGAVYRRIIGAGNRYRRRGALRTSGAARSGKA